ncbi:hypothetical protein [Rhodopseudomonas sp. BR0M22]|uniref:hypothetical protein n=1 Tax=Rhodopseudomonas sp. BR0M22 TaxID=2269369 RepID=UPI001968583A|nr:hypothetical protein [Rhodopseudomonas sp. BR0M22]NEW91349.1 hypothetical protein [Rhodopseudomonas sp. BR0M22]
MMKLTNRRRAELANAKASAERARAKYHSLMERSYLDPESAERKMEVYRAKHGDKALQEKLADNARKTAFGRRPGSIASRDGYAPGAGERREGSHIARQYLPEATLEKIRAEERLKYAERAAGGDMLSAEKQQPDKPETREAAPRAGKSFKQKLADQQMTSSKDKAALDRLKADRGKDRDIER